MWATIASAAVAAASSIFGGISKSRSARRSAKEIDADLKRRDAENKSYFNRNYYSDATEMADNRRVLTMASDRLRRQSSADAGRNAMMGATNAQSAASKEAATQAYADVASQVASNAQTHKQKIEDNYRAGEAALSNSRVEKIKADSAANQAAIDGAVAGVNGVAQSIASLDSKSDLTASNEVKQEKKDNNGTNR